MTTTIASAVSLPTDIFGTDFWLILGYTNELDPLLPSYASATVDEANSDETEVHLVSGGTTLVVYGSFPPYPENPGDVDAWRTILDATLITQATLITSSGTELDITFDTAVSVDFFARTVGDLLADDNVITGTGNADAIGGEEGHDKLNHYRLASVGCWM